MSDDPKTQVLVWRYGARKGVAIPPEVDEQLRLGHELREHLVDLAHERERGIADVWAHDSEIVVAERAARESHAQLDELLARAANERIRGRKRVVPGELQEEIAKARQSTRDARTTVREAKEGAYARLAAALHEVRDVERQARKRTYAEFVQRPGGLTWATFNNVVRKHTLADRRVSAKRKEGRPARLRHHRYDGTGRIVVQLQRKAVQPERTAELLCTPESPWWGMLQLPEVAAVEADEWAALTRAEQRKRGRAQIALRIGSNKDRSPILWEIPVQIHRPIPSDAEVLYAEVVITRVADERRVSVNLTIRTSVPRAIDGPAMAVDIGWRSMRDGSLRVAYWRGLPRTQPVRVPADLTKVLHLEPSGREGTVHIPASWRRLDERIARIHARRARNYERIKTIVSGYLERDPKLAETLRLAPGDVKRWRSPARMVELGRRVEGMPKIADELDSWERKDRRLWRREANEREQLILRRRDAYRRIAALLTRSWPHVILEERFVARVVRRPGGEQTDDYQGERARANASLAAPADLADAIRNATRRSGGSVTEVDPKLSTRRHHACGEPLPGEVDTAANTSVECPRCGETFDQDANATANMLAEWSAARQNGGVPRTRGDMLSVSKRPRGGSKSVTTSIRRLPTPP